MSTPSSTLALIDIENSVAVHCSAICILALVLVRVPSASHYTSTLVDVLRVATGGGKTRVAIPSTACARQANVGFKNARTRCHTNVVASACDSSPLTANSVDAVILRQVRALCCASICAHTPTIRIPRTTSGPWTLVLVGNARAADRACTWVTLNVVPETP